MIKNREVALKILQVGKAGFSTQEDGFKKLDECIELIDKHVAEQLILSDVGCSCANKKEKPKAPSNRIVNNTRPVADSKKA